MSGIHWSAMTSDLLAVRLATGNGVECGMRRKVGLDAVVAAEAPGEGIEHRGQGGRLIVDDQNGGSLEHRRFTCARPPGNGP
jgi:hypothetical protein